MSTTQSSRKGVIAGSALAAVVAAGAIAAFALAGPSATTAAPAPQAPATSAAALAPVQLVAFTGQQPEGFTLASVPEGWVVQGSDAGSLVMAPKDATDTNPASFVGKIAVFLQDFTPDLPTTEVNVGGKPGVIVTMEDSETRTIFVKQDSGSYLSVQIWEGLNWDTEMIVQFAAGITVTGDAQVTAG